MHARLALIAIHISFVTTTKIVRKKKRIITSLYSFLLYSFGERGYYKAILVPMYCGFFLMLRMTVNCQLDSSLDDASLSWEVSGYCVAGIHPGMFHTTV